ncbi:hypothetical protein HYH03_018364 [Edaphochlamys debaryana]|uniref:Uncharacterized protein n=1 Tax=Edaphochlamys debaryana TaxID=47281 RepID=A0A835XES9_9CHLO|nr:hypothetical protein HYH03_018364 [Edaphochlamys debaryana]|eukprot:KAG2482733.1 hypothetical protein HYH03_018364 [Edaphochlamys debaryana]
MKADLERLRARQGQSSSQEGPLRQPTPSTTGGSSDEGLFASAKETLDKILIADFFLILFILAWLAAGVVQAGLGGGSSSLLDAWYPLWPILWQPALGILMAGALVSGGIGWVAEQQQKR